MAPPHATSGMLSVMLMDQAARHICSKIYLVFMRLASSSAGFLHDEQEHAASACAARREAPERCIFSLSDNTHHV
jgi:hypothetical protein